jgi:hypothetical protein
MAPTLTVFPAPFWQPTVTITATAEMRIKLIFACMLPPSYIAEEMKERTALYIVCCAKRPRNGAPNRFS